VLIQVMWGSDAWGSLGWEATRGRLPHDRTAVEIAPDAFSIYEPMVRFISITWRMLAVSH
jgi:hypothetical protein